MGQIDLTALTGAAAQAGGTPDARAVDREKVRQLAQQFESLLITNMLREMRKTLMTSDDEEKQGLGADVMTDTIDAQLGDALSRAGGVGLASVLLKAFDRSQSTGGEAQAPAAPASQTSESDLQVRPPSQTSESDFQVRPPSQASESGFQVRLEGPVTSAFGWRRDPFSGAARFHAGTDLRAAYGSDVHAAAAGTVTYAGEQRGYGLTVVIDHGNGVSTRYAHLSGYAVQPGDAVGSGQVVARTGNSGRSTGPHLHFELLKDGRPVDPGTAIKGVSQIADSKAYQSVQEEYTR